METVRGHRKRVGIIGGMGPGATCELFARVIALTPARRDQDHLHLVIDNDPTVPDRTEALLGRASSPVPWLIASAKRLTACDVELLAIPCVTSHAYLPEVRDSVELPVLSIVEETERVLAGRPDPVACLGVMATDGSVQADVFGPLRATHELLVPPPEEQARLMEAIYGPHGVKTVGPTPEARALMTKCAAGLLARGAQAIIAGCTEVPLGMAGSDLDVEWLDSLEILAAAIVREAWVAPDVPSVPGPATRS